jgi:hypothetical protein
MEAVLEVREDRCFQDDAWVSLGNIILRPGAREQHQGPSSPWDDAIRFGYYEWHVPHVEVLNGNLLRASLIVDAPDEKTTGHKRKLFKTLDGLVHVAQRMGLLHPVFDAGGIIDMPFRRPTTVVGDTNSVLQGALDFVVRFLCPMARIKVPAIAQMEILVWADNFIRVRHDKKKLSGGAVGTVLLDHMRGQGAQRTLLRLELLTNIEVERARLGADPLRGIVHPDPDQEHKNLELHVVQRSFADRLIFETAIQHLHQSAPGHIVFLLTSDQGLARMALAEGLRVLYYEAASVNTIAGSVLPGTQFNPFTGELYPVSLGDLVWELAVTFGRCRLKTKHDHWIEVAAIGETLKWKADYAREDLLWSSRSSQDTMVPSETEDIAAPPMEEGEVVSPAPPPTTTPTRSIHHSYKFSTKVMLRLIQHLTIAGPQLNADLMKYLHFTHERKLAEYRGFLVSGGFVTYSKGTIEKTELLESLWTAFKNRDFESLAPLLLRVESLNVNFEHLKKLGKLNLRGPLPIKADAIPNYRCLLEAAALGLHLADEAFYVTDVSPTPSDFTTVALQVYEALTRPDDKYVATGSWLEELARRHRIHPLVARRRLEEARAAGYIERYVEGSTPDTRFATHTFCMLDVVNGELTVRQVPLYEGDFLLPGKGSVSLRLKRASS